MLTTHLNLVQRLKMSGAIPLRPLHAIMACERDNLTLYLAPTTSPAAQPSHQLQATTWGLHTAADVTTNRFR